MSAVAAAVVGSAVIGGVVASSSASKAARAQTQAADAAAAEQRAAREQLRQLLQPWVGAGNQALTQQMQLLGLNGIRNQRAAVQGIENSPMFRSLAAQGEDAILQNASATGGLRGGNTQGALAQFRPALLNQQIQQQYQNLAGLSAAGQNSAAGVGAAGMQAADNIGNFMTQAGQAQAGGYLGQGNAINSGLGQIGNFAASGGFNGLFGGGVTGSTVAGLAPSAGATIASNPGIF